MLDIHITKCGSDRISTHDVSLRQLIWQLILGCRRWSLFANQTVFTFWDGIGLESSTAILLNLLSAHRWSTIKPYACWVSYNKMFVSLQMTFWQSGQYQSATTKPRAHSILRRWATVRSLVCAELEYLPWQGDGSLSIAIIWTEAAQNGSSHLLFLCLCLFIFCSKQNPTQCWTKI